MYAPRGSSFVARNGLQAPVCSERATRMAHWSGPKRVRNMSIAFSAALSRLLASLSAGVMPAFGASRAPVPGRIRFVPDGTSSLGRRMAASLGLFAGTKAEIGLGPMPAMVLRSSVCASKKTSSEWQGTGHLTCFRAGGRLSLLSLTCGSPLYSLTHEFLQVEMDNDADGQRRR